MPWALNTYQPFNEFLTELQDNNPAHRSLIPMGDDAFGPITYEQKRKIFKLLAKNHSCTQLSLSSMKLGHEFIEDLIGALQKNTTLTTLEYNKKKVSKKDIHTIQKILDRNRKSALDKKIQPHPTEMFLSDDTNKKIDACINAAEQGNLNKLYTLILQDSKLINAHHWLYLSPLHIAAKYGQVDCVKLLLQFGAEVNDNPEGSKGTPLHAAVEQNHFVIAQLLLNAGADLELKWNGHTPLLQVNDVEMAELLLKHKANINAVCGTESQAGMCHGNNILHAIIYRSWFSEDLLSFFLKKGIDVNARNAHGETPLHILAWWTASETLFNTALPLLLQAGANPTLKDNTDHTPLDAARHHPFKIKLLTAVTKNYKPEAADNSGCYHLLPTQQKRNISELDDTASSDNIARVRQKM